MVFPLWIQDFCMENNGSKCLETRNKLKKKLKENSLKSRATELEFYDIQHDLESFSSRWGDDL